MLTNQQEKGVERDKRNQRTIRGNGSSQVGSLRAEKILYEERSAAFDAIRIIALKLRVQVQHLWRKLFKRD